MPQKTFTLDCEKLAKKDHLNITESRHLHLKTSKYIDLVQTFLGRHITENIRGVQRQDMIEEDYEQYEGIPITKDSLQQITDKINRKVDSPHKYFSEGFEAIINPSPTQTTQIQYQEQHRNTVFEIDLLYQLLNRLNKKRPRILITIPKGLIQIAGFSSDFYDMEIFDSKIFRFTYFERETFYKSR